MASKVMVFIDGSNFYHGLKANSLTTKIDFEKFSNALADGRELVRTYYYNAAVNQQQDPQTYKTQQTFLNNLRRTPYLEVKLGYMLVNHLTCNTCSNSHPYSVEKGVDIQIASDMIWMAYQNLYDTAILVSSDGDFGPACQVVKNLGKHIENVYFKKSSSWHLLNICDKQTLIDAGFINNCTLGQP